MRCFCLLAILFVSSSSALPYHRNYHDGLSNYGRINYTDPYYGQIYFEGDILLQGRNPHDRNAIRDKALRWPNKVVYYWIDAKYSHEERQVILDAMEEYHKHTCIKFVERYAEPEFLWIYPGSGCNSAVGKIGGVQYLSLEKPGCIYRGIAMHELMHAIGFWHEQSRADRDSYVTVHWDNIPKNLHFAFDKYGLEQIDHLGESYDYYSIMHYPAWSFALDNTKPTISPTKPDVTLEDLGRNYWTGFFTPVDVAKINKLYEC